MTDWGVHLLDYALYGMNVTAPQSIMASGGKFGYPDDACETPDLLQTVYTFKDFTVMWDHAIGIDDGAYGRTHGLGFVGENGTLVVDRGFLGINSSTNSSRSSGAASKGAMIMGWI